MSNINVRRNPADYNIVESSSELLGGARWSNLCGGIYKFMPVYTVYAYMDYIEMNEAGITSSGQHAFGNNSGKVCICKCDNTGKGKEEYEEAYYWLVVCEDHNQKSYPYNKKRTKIITDLLKDNPEGITRKDIRKKLVEAGYRENEIREALYILNKAGFLEIKGSPKSQNSIISLLEDFDF